MIAQVSLIWYSVWKYTAKASVLFSVCQINVDPGEGFGPSVRTAFSPSQGPEIIHTCVSEGSAKSGTGEAPNKLAIPQPTSLAV